ncbi:hypothetical protein [Microseira sp. BLCC-F43]|jgi:predicted  nucleic acid-binding Zn-ribbon protein|uniref:hypothetical protein n=1 Tax=Microseira sp. BLCC-F43 TaxID=3153602 RepID=UPI0035B6C43A
MEVIVNQIREAIAAAINLIRSQKETINNLRSQLAEVSEEYAEFREQEAQEDAAADAMLAQLEQIAQSLSEVVAEAGT